MNTIEKQSINQAILENISAYPEDYPIQEINGGVSPTDDCCSAIARYIANEYSNNPDCEKFDKDDFTQVCIDSFYSLLQLSDDNNTYIGNTYEFFKQDVNKFLWKLTI